MAKDMNPVRLICPYLENMPWFRGNLHTHTANSDGTGSPEEVIAEYEHRGYQDIMIRDG